MLNFIEHIRQQVLEVSSIESHSSYPMEPAVDMKHDPPSESQPDAETTNVLTQKETAVSTSVAATSVSNCHPTTCNVCMHA